MNCKKSMLRKTMLYKTDVEYGDYTINHVLGCSHGCIYPCYAMMMAKRFGKVKNYDEWITPVIVSNALEILQKELPKIKNRIKSVQLCFTTDPFMYGYDDITSLSIEIIKYINSFNIPCTALTKGILPNSLKDLSKDNSYGITLISLDEGFRKEIEPGAAPYKKRIEHLKYLHDNGCKTWISIEPYPTPNFIDQDFGKILDAVSFADKIIFGRLNYNKKVSEYKDYRNYYNKLAKTVIEFCNRNGIDYHIKDGTISKI